MEDLKKIYIYIYIYTHKQWQLRRWPPTVTSTVKDLLTMEVNESEIEEAVCSIGADVHFEQTF